MVVLFNAFLCPMTQVARKDVGDIKPRQQMRDWLTYQDEKTERAHFAA